MTYQLTEDDLQTRVIHYARLRGWMVVHYRPCRTQQGWRTAVEGDRGAPDLLLARRGYVLLAELKSDRGKTTSTQRLWGEHLGDAYRLWRPKDWDLIKQELW